ncbi:MAG TPA: SDR family oxidoreductase [Nevskiaceae bacterium]|nr:SDR family oxidoreductase [Nevskiaceae bacterium]
MDTRKAIFITGAGAGIGRATALLFAARGWFVGLYDVDEAAVQKLAGELGANAVCGKLDVSDYAQFEAALVQFMRASGGRLDVMFNNAGIVAVANFEDLALARLHRLVDVNFKGVINGCHAALPHLKRTPGARVISMCSASAIYGAPSFAVYSATKFAVRGLTEALDVEWSRFGIRVMDVMPLFVNTPMVTEHFDSTPKSLERLGLKLQADDIARTVWKAATRPRWLTHVHWLPGVQTWLLYLANKFSPAFLNRYTTKAVSGY